jgi:predicted nucleic acid-binding Zn ribbon protein
MDPYVHKGALSLRRPSLLQNVMSMLAIASIDNGYSPDPVRRAIRRAVRHGYERPHDPVKAAAIRMDNAVRNERNYILQKKAKGQLKHNPNVFNPTIGIRSHEHCRVCCWNGPYLVKPCAAHINKQDEIASTTFVKIQ